MVETGRMITGFQMYDETKAVESSYSDCSTSLVYNLLFTSKNKRSDCWDETGKERIEGEGADQTAVAKLDYSSKQNVKQVCINNFQFLRRRLHVLIVEPGNNGSQTLWHLDSREHNSSPNVADAQHFTHA